MINNRNLDDFGGKLVAERVGFEPTVPCDTPHFECGALDHYATSPQVRSDIIPDSSRIRLGCPTVFG